MGQAELVVDVFSLVYTMFGRDKIRGHLKIGLSCIKQPTFIASPKNVRKSDNSASAFLSGNLSLEVRTS